VEQRCWTDVEWGGGVCCLCRLVWFGLVWLAGLAGWLAGGLVLACVHVWCPFFLLVALPAAFPWGEPWAFGSLNLETRVLMLSRIDTQFE
jgi:hypothetical protein